MNDMNHFTQDPDPQFIDALEQQIRMTMRRSSLLDSIDRDVSLPKRKGMNMLGIATLMLASMMLGATGTYAVVHQDPGPQRELLVRKAEIYLRQAQLRYQQAEADYEELKPLIEQEYMSKSEAEELELKIHEARAEVEHRQFDVDETLDSGKPVNDDLSAPLVKGKDFVIMRLEVRLKPAEFLVKLARNRVARVEELFENLYISELDVEAERINLQQTTLALQWLTERLDLRQSFIDGELSAQEVELRSMLRKTESELKVFELQATDARRRFERMTLLEQEGRVNPREVRQARVDFHDAESRLELAILQLELIEQQLQALEEK